LHGVKKDSGFLRIEAAMQNVFADLRNRHLDRASILQDGKEEGSRRFGGRGADVNPRWATDVVEAAKLLIAQGGRSATVSTYFYVLATFAWIR
jgi:hypothetical protein